MKKRSFGMLLIAGILIAALTGCSAATPPPNLTTRVWTANGAEEADGWMTETLEYSVRIDKEYKPSDESAPKIKAAADSEGNEIPSSYTTVMRWRKNDDSNFTLTTKLQFSGQYLDTMGNLIGEPFTDVNVSTVTFNGVTNGNLSPVSSEKTFLNTVVYTDNDGKYQTRTLRYRQTITYDVAGKIATSTLNAYNEESSKTQGKDVYDLPVPIVASRPELQGERPQSATYKKLNKKTPYYDSDQMIFAVRAMGSTAKGTFSSAFSTIDVMATSFEKITAASSTADKNDSIYYKIPDYKVNGQEVVKEGARVTLSKSSGQSGRAIVVFYSTEKIGADETMLKLPLRIQQEMMIFDLQKNNGAFIASDPVTEEPKA